MRETEEQLEKTKMFCNLDKYEISSSNYLGYYISYDTSNKEYIFITLDRLNGLYHYGMFGDLDQLDSEITDKDGSMSRYKYGFKSLKEVIYYIENCETLKYTIINWPGTIISNLQLLEKAS